jgi:hypothetical protein
VLVVPHGSGQLRSRWGTKYPIAARVGAAAGAAHGAAYDPDHAYTFGLQRVLDGLGVLIDASYA